MLSRQAGRQAGRQAEANTQLTSSTTRSPDVQTCDRYHRCPNVVGRADHICTCQSTSDSTLYGRNNADCMVGTVQTVW